ncbi:hypothetical protein HK104_006098, partial [Borealophlyctis nickersoniae]
MGNPPTIRAAVSRRPKNSSNNNKPSSSGTVGSTSTITTASSQLASGAGPAPIFTFGDVTTAGGTSPKRMISKEDGNQTMKTLPFLPGPPFSFGSQPDRASSASFEVKLFPCRSVETPVGTFGASGGGNAKAKETGESGEGVFVFGATAGKESPSGTVKKPASEPIIRAAPSKSPKPVGTLKSSSVTKSTTVATTKRPITTKAATAPASANTTK